MKSVRIYTCITAMVVISACSTSNPEAPRPIVLRASPVNVSPIGKDLAAVGKDLTNSPADTNALGKDLTTLGKDLPSFGINLQSLGPTPNRAGNVPGTLETHLAALGTNLTSTDLGSDLTNLGTLWIKAPTNIVPEVQTQSDKLANDLKPLGANLLSIGNDLQDPKNTYSLADDLGPLGASPLTVGQHLSKLGLDFSSLPTNGAGTGLSLLGNELITAGTDLSPPAMTTNGPSLPYLFFISSGATFQSPYTVNYNPNVAPKTAVVTNAGHTVAGYLEFSFFNRFVLKTNRMPINAEDDNGRWHPANKWNNAWTFLNPDFEWHIGFLFANGTSSTNFSASTIAGSSDFYTDMSLGFPLLRQVQSGLVQQVTLETGGGVTTDENLLAVHPNAFVGLGYQADFLVPEILGSSSNAPFLIVGRFGCGFTDIPYLTSPSSDLNVLVTDLPRYTFKGAPAIGANLAYPISSSSFFNVRVNAYVMKDNPSPWNISAGVSFPLDSLGKVFTR